LFYCHLCSICQHSGQRPDTVLVLSADQRPSRRLSAARFKAADVKRAEQARPAPISAIPRVQFNKPSPSHAADGRRLLTDSDAAATCRRGQARPGLAYNRR
jgi:hypothetical protein